MVRRPRAALALLIATVLAATVPAAASAIGPSDPTGPAGETTSATPLGRNLLRNGSFEIVNEDGSLAAWQEEGKVRVEQFGDRPWPYPAYGAKYHGGENYLACNGSSGLVRQTVPFSGWENRNGFWLKAHLQVDFGGKIRHAIRVTIRATGPGVDRVNVDYKPLIITDHYKRSVAVVLVPPGTTELVSTIELVGTKNGDRCRIAADSVKLIVFKRYV